MRPPLAGAINQGRIARGKTSSETIFLNVILMLFKIVLMLLLLFKILLLLLMLLLMVH